MTGTRLVMDVSEVTQRMGTAADRMPAAMRRLMRNIATLVERDAIKRTGGSGASGAYPIPIRTGDLRRSIGSQADASSATIFSTAVHAGAQHRGYRPYGNPKAAAIPPRRFIFDAAESVDVEAEMQLALQQVIA